LYFQKQESWFVLFVNANQEDKVKKILEKNFGDEYKFIIPTRELRERKSGKWNNVRRKLFPGYILAKGIMNIEAYYKFREVYGVLKLLRNEDEVLTINEKELKGLNILIDNNLGISTLYKENDCIRILAGPLVGLEGQIVKIDFRKGRAKVNISFMNEERIIDLGIELVDKI